MARWLVFRMKRDGGSMDGAGDLPDGIFEMALNRVEEQNWRRRDENYHPIMSPIEAFVTRPWFMETSIGDGEDEVPSDNLPEIIRVCSKQLVHLHFIRQNPYYPDELIAMIPIYLTSKSGFRRNFIHDEPNGWMTACFRTMRSWDSLPNDADTRGQLNNPNRERGVPPGTSWWIERRTIMR